MRQLLIVPFLIILLSGCGIIDEPKENPQNYGIAIDVISENKQDIEYIKNRTADDIELGHKVREAIINDKLTNEQLGALARKTAKEQPTMPKENKPKEVKIKEESSSYWVKWSYVGIIAVILLVVAVKFTKRRKING